MKLMEEYGGRKFVLSVALLVFVLVLVGLGKVGWSDFTNFAQWIFGLFVIGNVAAKFSK